MARQCQLLVLIFSPCGPVKKNVLAQKNRTKPLVSVDHDPLLALRQINQSQPKHTDNHEPLLETSKALKTKPRKRNKPPARLHVHVVGSAAIQTHGTGGRTTQSGREEQTGLGIWPRTSTALPGPALCDLRVIFSESSSKPLRAHASLAVALPGRRPDAAQGK